MKEKLTKLLDIASVLTIGAFAVLILVAFAHSLDIDHYNQYALPFIDKQIGSFTFSLLVWGLYLAALHAKLKGLSLPYFLLTFVVWDGQAVFADPNVYNPNKFVWWVPYSITHPLYLVLLVLTASLMVIYWGRYRLTLSPWLFVAFLIVPVFSFWLTAPYLPLHYFPELTDSILLCALFYQGVKLNEVPKRDNPVQ